MTLKDFKIMCILSGTDYNINYNRNSIFKIYKNYLLYKKKYNNNNFLEWITKQNNNYNINEVYNTLELFYVNRNIKNYDIQNRNFVDKISLYKLLEKEYFLNPITVY
jgi:hypothetical protein